MIQCSQCGTMIQTEAESCPTCGSILTRKRAEQDGGEDRAASGIKQWAVRGLVVLILVLGLGIFLDQLLRTYHPVIEKQPIVAMSTMYRDDKTSSTLIEASMDQGFITISLKEVQERRLVRFFDPEKIQQIPMIAYITPQGKLVTAMSKSEHCGSTDFYLSGSDIHCASCPSYWNMASLEAYACCQKYYPDPFPSTVVGDVVRIDPNIIRNWESRL